MLTFLRREMGVLKQFFCFHRTVHIQRRHATTVKEEMRPKLLFVDRHEVHNFVVCSRCGHMLKTDQRERIYEQKGQP